MSRVLITGATGFAGSHLAEYLVSTGKYEVFGTYLFEESLLSVKDIKKKINLIKADLADQKQIEKVIKKASPSIIFHLAALTSPADSFKDPVRTVTENTALQINLFESLRKNGLFDTKILVVSSGEIYGMVKKENLPVNEQTPLRPANPYSVSKIAQDFLGLTYFLSYKMKVIRVRPFNHIGPGQSPHFVVSSFAKQIAEIERGKKEPILKVGNLDAKRDFTDVRDMVCAYALVIEKGELGEVYNIGNGKSYKIKDILDELVAMSTSKIKIKKDEKLLRPSDIPDLYSDLSKIKKATNWKPLISIDQTLKDTLDYWRNII